MKKIAKRKIFVIMIILLMLLGLTSIFYVEKKEIYKNINNEKKEANELLSSEIETTYVVNSIEGETINVTITIKNNNGIQSIIAPDGNEIIIKDENKTKFAMDYDVISGQNYKFKLKYKGEEELKEYILNADLNAKPIINIETSKNYPTLTADGFVLQKNISIDYGDGINNYYSIDNGITWNKYKGPITVTERKGKIIAKTIQENEIKKFISQEWQMDLASDAIGSNAYDGKNDTIAKGNRDDIPENVTAGKVSNARFNVDNSAWGKTISIYSYLSASDRYNNYEMYVYDLSGTKIDTIILGDCRFNSYSKVVKYTIPQNVAYIINNNYNMSSCGIWEISISN